VFGSEMGMEWAIPHAHYFEGILSRRGKRNSPRRDCVIIPLFELIYHDCIAMYTHQGDRAGPADAEYILYHLSLARMPLYRFGAHLYWQKDPALPQVLRVFPSIKTVEQQGARAFAITYEWDVAEKVGQDVRCFVHFTDAAGEIKFQNDHVLPVPASQWQPGQRIVDGPYRVEIPEGAEGLFDVRVGLVADGKRLKLAASDDGDSRYTIGKIRVAPDRVTLRRESLRKEPRDTACFAKGWGEELGPTDAFIRNTYEFMSPTNELAMMLLMTDHRFLNAERSAELTVFGDNEVRIVVNAGPKDLEFEGVRLPPFGFVVTSPTFIAYHARNWSGIAYEEPTLMTMRSLDGLPLAASKRVRLYRGFGGRCTRVPGAPKDVSVERERVLGR